MHNTETKPHVIPLAKTNPRAGGRASIVGVATPKKDSLLRETTMDAIFSI